jgi:hypothetical protein
MEPADIAQGAKLRSGPDVPVLEQFQRRWEPVSRQELRKNNKIEHLR